MRLFYALDLPPASRQALLDRSARWRRRCEAEGLRLRWVCPEHLHVTLHFLGEVSAERVSDLGALLASLAASHQAALARLGPVGVFGHPSHARVLMVPIEDLEGRLAALAAELRVATTRLGIAAEPRAYRPHVTLARFAVPSDVRALLSEQPDPSAALPLTLDRVVLYHSLPSPSGSEYRALAACQLPRSA